MVDIGLEVALPKGARECLRFRFQNFSKCSRTETTPARPRFPVRLSSFLSVAKLYPPLSRVPLQYQPVAFAIYLRPISTAPDIHAPRDDCLDSEKSNRFGLRFFGNRCPKAHAFNGLF